MPANKVQSPKLKVKNEVPKSSKLSVTVYDLAGKEAGSLNLPEEIFGVEVNNDLLAQAIRVYQTNQRAHWSNTKTRGQVKGSSRKIFRQKGTGNARHGSVRAPIFVGGGIALGPKFRKTTLDLPKKMKKAALVSALSLKAKEKELVGVVGLEKLTGKTKEVAKFLEVLNKDNSLIVLGEKNQNLQRSVKNLQKASSIVVDQLNTFEVLKYQNLLVTKEAVEKLGKGEK